MRGAGSPTDMSRKLSRTSWAALAAGLSWSLPSGKAEAQGYVRVGIVAALASDSQFMDVDCASTTPAALYGCGEGGDGAGLRTAGEFGAAEGLELGAGYRVGPAVQVELQVEYRPAVPFAGRANFLAPEREQSVAVERSSLSGVILVELDLASLGAPAPGGFRPFAGAGIGRVRHRLDETRMTFPRTETVVPGDTRTDRTWTVTAGLSRTLSERTSLDLSWRYADRGEAFTAEGAGRVEWRDGSRTIPLELAPTRASVSGHGVRVGVRYRW